MRSFRIAALGVVVLVTLFASPIRAQQPVAGVKIAFIRSQTVVESAPGRADAEKVDVLAMYPPGVIENSG